jgi:hypothetical protein
MSKQNLKYLFLNLALLLFSLPLLSQNETKKDINHIADKPLYRDPIFDGAADPIIIWNDKEKKWFMFYTNRRAKDSTAKGITWVHGTRIGVATSTDGTKWTYKDTCNINYRIKDVTYWAPDVIKYKNKYHMYLTIVPRNF